MTTLWMRMALGAVFIAFGLEQLQTPGAWVSFLPTVVSGWLHDRDLAPTGLILLVGSLQVVLGVQVLAGLFLRLSAALTGLILIGAISSFGLDPSGVRDFGLLVGLSVPLALAEPDPWTLDRAWRSHRLSWTWHWLQPGWLVLVVAVAATAFIRPQKAHDSEETPLFASIAPVAAKGKQPRSEPISPIPKPAAIDSAKVDLGRRLFHERKLSGDGTISCASCHEQSLGGADGKKVPVGIGGQRGLVNTPTVFNAVFNSTQFWDGRVDSLKRQADGPVENPLEMGAKWAEVEERLKLEPGYSGMFAKVYPARGINRETITEAIAAYEATLVTPGSKLDRWLLGDETAMSADELEGYGLFKSIGCIACHQGVNLGGNMFQTMGKFGDYFGDRGGPVTRADLGRFNVTGQKEDRHRFKVPGLRNLALTAPYFHDGSADTLETAVSVMARYQLGRRLTTGETTRIVAFLRTLNGEIPDAAQD